MSRRLDGIFSSASEGAESIFSISCLDRAHRVDPLSVVAIGIRDQSGHAHDDALRAILKAVILVGKTHLGRIDTVGQTQALRMLDYDQFNRAR
jgi:hypothetical protein